MGYGKAVRLLKSNNTRIRIYNGIGFACLLIIEVLIALYVRDAFIRPYGGDILVTILLCCFVRIFFPRKIKLLPLWVFLFAVAVEIGQYINIVDLIGLGRIPFFRVLIGTSFSFIDILCYGAGCLLFWVTEYFIFKKSNLKI